MFLLYGFLLIFVFFFISVGCCVRGLYCWIVKLFLVLFLWFWFVIFEGVVEYLFVLLLLIKIILLDFEFEIVVCESDVCLFLK